MTDILDWLFGFMQKVFAVPGLHAILTGVVVGFALSYAAATYLPAQMKIKRATHWIRAIVCLSVFVISFVQIPTPVMFCWAGSVAIFTPQFYEWATQIIFHKWPWLKPAALMTQDELEKVR